MSARALLRSGGLGMRRLIRVGSSDRESELGEGCREAQAWRGVGGEFVVAAVQVLHERVAGGDSCGRAEAFSPRIGRSRAFSRL